MFCFAGPAACGAPQMPGSRQAQLLPPKLFSDGCALINLSVHLDHHFRFGIEPSKPLVSHRRSSDQSHRRTSPLECRGRSCCTLTPRCLIDPYLLSRRISPEPVPTLTKC